MGPWFYKAVNGTYNNHALIITNAKHATFYGNITMPSGSKLYLDGGTNTHITESSDGVILMVMVYDYLQQNKMELKTKL